MMILPILLATLAYAFYFLRSSRAHSLYLKTKEIIHKDHFVDLHRKVIWIYDNFIFSYSLSLLYLTAFQMFIYELSDLTKKSEAHHFYVKISFGLS